MELLLCSVFFFFVFRGEKLNQEKHPFLIALFVSVVFALLITVVSLFMILMLSGSVNIISLMFKASLSKEQIIYYVV